MKTMKIKLVIGALVSSITSLFAANELNTVAKVQGIKEECIEEFTKKYPSKTSEVRSIIVANFDRCWELSNEALVEAYQSAEGTMLEPMLFWIITKKSLLQSVAGNNNTSASASTNNNPYAVKSVDELVGMLDNNPELSKDKLFMDTFIIASGGTKEHLMPPMDVSELIYQFPLDQVLEKSCNLDDFRRSLDGLSQNYSADDSVIISDRLKNFLTENGLVAIRTPGLGNCAFDAALLAWSSMNGLHEPQRNTALGWYFEKQMTQFREEIANLAQAQINNGFIKDKNGDSLVDEIKPINQYVQDSVFRFIAQKLGVKIILISEALLAQCSFPSPQQDTSATTTEEDTRKLINDHPDALLVCHNGHDHFLGVIRK